MSILVARSAYIPGHLMAPFLNGIIFSTGRAGALHCGLWRCQAIHKLTRKPVASGFPRPSGAVMFTTPCPHPDTLVCQSLLQQLVRPSITEHSTRVVKYSLHLFKITFIMIGHLKDRKDGRIVFNFCLIV